MWCMKLSEILQATSKYKEFSISAETLYCNKIHVQTFVEAYEDKNHCKLKYFYDCGCDRYEFKRI